MWLVAGLSKQRPGFEPKLVYTGFVVDNVVMGQVFPEYFGFILPISLHECLILIYSFITEVI
jgi:hypothetical protein